MPSIPGKGIRTQATVDPLLDALRTITKQPNATATQLASQLMAGSQRVEIAKTSQLQNDVPFATVNQLQQAIAAQNLAKVASTGDYADLKNQPFIPKTASDVGAATAEQGAKADAAASAADLGRVAFSNSYNDLDDLPTLLQGEQGNDGPAATIAIGSVTSGPSPQVTNSGDSHNAIFNFVLQQGAPGDRGKDGVGIQGDKGNDGRQVALRTYGNFLQYQYVGDSTWTQLYDLSQLQGKDGHDGINGINGTSGREVEFEVASGYIRWRYVGDSTWRSLIALSELRGPAGRDGVNGSNGKDGVSPALQAGMVTTLAAGSSATMTITGTQANPILNLGIPAGATGSNGQNGSDGRAVQMQVANGFIQWRLVGDTAWQNLIATSALMGGPGAAATVTIGTVTQLAAGAAPTVTNSGTSAAAVLNFGLPTGATGQNGTSGISYAPQAPVARTIAPATAYQHTDVTKPAKVIVNARATQAVTLLALTAIDKVELRIGPTAASVLSSTTGFQVGVWESGITGLSVMVGASIQDGGQLTGELPAGWYFAVNRISGNNAQIVNCFTQSLTA